MANANDTGNNRMTDFPPFSSPSTPLQLCGFLTGDTVQVQGDTGDLQFSVKFNIHRKEHLSAQATFPGVENVRNSDSAYVTPACSRHDQIQNALAEVQNNEISRSTYGTPPCTRHEQIQNALAEVQNNEISTSEVDTSDAFQNIDIPEVEDVGDHAPYSAAPTCAQQNHIEEEDTTAYAGNQEIWTSEVMMTRLRSGALTPVKYYLEGRCSASTGGTLRPRRRTRSRNVLEKMLKRRSLPVRPANAYAFFVIANWGKVKNAEASFTGTSRKLSKMWFRLPKDKKKEYEDMASEDNARYRRQCILLKNDEATSD